MSRSVIALAALFVCLLQAEVGYSFRPSMRSRCASKTHNYSCLTRGGYFSHNMHRRALFGVASSGAGASSDGASGKGTGGNKKKRNKTKKIVSSDFTDEYTIDYTSNFTGDYSTGDSTSIGGSGDYTDYTDSADANIDANQKDSDSNPITFTDNQGYTYAFDAMDLLKGREGDDAQVRDLGESVFNLL